MGVTFYMGRRKKKCIQNVGGEHGHLEDDDTSLK
jgi:hypothetical protein